MTVRVHVDDNYQIVVPEVLRESLRIERGDELLVEVRDGYALLMPVPGDFARRMLGLHREIWEGGDAQEYVRQERDEWESSK